MTNSEILKEILIECNKRRIDFTISQEEDEINVKYVEGDPNSVYLNIPDFDNENLPNILMNCLEKIKTIPS
ncbi:MAG TPA: hypothetical protein PK698_02030 [Bacilli bacterium]|mgnify:CR=1 FL=1|jgi:hypothetical protein|nr:hypothetical protein [Bacilli bacterium]